MQGGPAESVSMAGSAVQRGYIFTSVHSETSCSVLGYPEDTHFYQCLQSSSRAGRNREG